MNLVDANVLIYAVNEADPRHEVARGWLDTALSGTETVGFAWLVLLAFLRLSTRFGLFPRPLTIDAALTQVAEWTAQPSSVVVHPTAGHQTFLTRLLSQVGSGGNLVSDAHLAALALESHATIITYDNDFARFPGVRWKRPAAK